MEYEADGRSGGEEIQPVGEKDEEETCGSGERTKQGRERFSLFKPWERVGCKPNQECSLNRSQVAAGRVLASCPQLSQTGEKEGRKRWWLCRIRLEQKKECRWRNMATCFFLTLKNWGGGGGWGVR